MKKVVLTLFCSISLFAFSLDEALSELEKNNLDIQISKKQRESSLLQKEQKSASQFGKITLNSSITKYNDKRTLAPLAPPISSDVVTSDKLTTVGVSYKVTLFDGFGVKSEIDLSKINSFISKEKEKLTLNQLKYNTQSLFSDILSLQNSKKSYEEYQKVLKSFKTIVEKEFEYGKKAKVDILKVESDIEKNQAKIIELDTKIKILKNSLSLLIYGETKTLDELEDITFLQTSQEYSLENLPSIKVAKSIQKKSDKNYNKALSSYYPVVNFETSYSNVYGEGEKEAVSTIALQLSWNIFDFGVRQKNLQKTKIEKLEANLEYEKLKNEYKNRILEAKELIIQNESLLKSAKAQFSLAQKTTQIEKIRYEANQISINDYLLSFSNEQFLKSNEIQANSNLLKARFYYAYLTKE